MDVSPFHGYALDEFMGGGGGEGRKASLIAQQYERGERIAKAGFSAPEKYPTNEEVAKAVQQKVAAAVEMSRKYRHVAWYSLFVAAYMVVLYLQASAYKSTEVVQTLKDAFMPAGAVGSTITFQNEAEVLNYIGAQILLPIWQDPVCGDGNCEWPWEYPSWGPFGCKADCGTNSNVTSIVVNVKADFTGHPTISPQVLMANAVWNLCLDDPTTRARGEADLCWFPNDVSFTEVVVNTLDSMSVIDGNWYVIVKGDYAGRVYGNIYDISNATNPVPISTSPAWTACQLTISTTPSATTTAVRRLMQAYTQAHRAPTEEHGRRIILEAVDEIQEIPELRHVDFSNVRRLSSVASTTEEVVESASDEAEALYA
ncbi:hypothetical protein CEUSTIGMA_g11280.t1 [Chlamydomonas eustigma]|uniref:Uncharacterized protein n=1 Tax=Chlamydomonas eustigma TaxID=1157962 RepID=A0A250XL76_9CHLO|nr:hypothetical protein CEUSTIGMA_g11280.t1 [Chlamydomonas eustigma]|eukprot:GAX83855.1 hypothetical protein CEUSTIGMA_g11280.t1 [Chlamydomonas eustigma]